MSEDQKVSRGERFRPNAALNNTLADVANAFRASRLPSGPSEGSDLSAASPVTVRIKNSTASLLPRGSVLAIANTLRAASSTEWKNAIELVGAAPSAGYEGKFAILQSHAPAGGIAEATLAGAAQVDINVRSSTHKFAEIEPGRTDRLISVASGSAQILWVAGTSGVQAAVVRLLAPPTAVARCVIVGEPAFVYNTAGSVSMLYPQPVGQCTNDTHGLWVFPYFSGQLANAAGTVFQFANTPPANYTVPMLYLHAWTYYRISVHTVWQLYPMLQTYDIDAFLRDDFPYHQHYYQDDNYIPAGTSFTMRQTGTMAGITAPFRKVETENITLATEIVESPTVSGTGAGNLRHPIGMSSAEVWTGGAGSGDYRKTCHSGVILIGPVHPYSYAGGHVYPKELRLRVYRPHLYQGIQPLGSCLISLQITVEQSSDHIP